MRSSCRAISASRNSPSAFMDDPRIASRTALNADPDVSAILAFLLRGNLRESCADLNKRYENSRTTCGNDVERKRLIQGHLPSGAFGAATSENICCILS